MSNYHFMLKWKCLVEGREIWNLENIQSSENFKTLLGFKVQENSKTVRILKYKKNWKLILLREKCRPVILEKTVI